MARMFSLTQQTGRAIGFRFMGSVLNTAFSLAIGIILARILSPKEFGLFGIAASISYIAEILGSCGLLRALVQRKNLTPEHETAAALFQLGSAGLMSSLLFFGAPAAERWFGMPGLAYIAKLQAGALLLHAIKLIPESRLTRRLAFDRLTAILISSRILGGGVTLTLAFHGLGAVALAIGSLTHAAIQVLLLWMCAPGFIPLVFRIHHLRELFRYGSGILLISIANILAQRVDNFIIGRQLGSEAVGLYERAFHLALLPLQHVTGSVHKVLFAALSSIQDDMGKFQRGYLKAVRLSALVAFPLLTALGTSAAVIIPFLYGPMWAETVPILQILAIAGIFRILSNTQGLVVQARGRPMAEAVLQVVWLGLVVILGFIGSKAGTLGVTVGVSLATFVFCVCMTRLALSIACIRFVDWLNTMRTGFLGSVVMGLSILLVRTACDDYLPSFILIVVISLSGLLSYIIFLRLCLTAEDNELLESIYEIFPSRVGDILRFIFGMTTKDSMREPKVKS
jgi:O-antigen/teichoic acid export membrane protein